MVFWGMVWLFPPPQILKPQSSDLFIVSLSSVRPRLLLNRRSLLFRGKAAVDSPKQSPALWCTAGACPCRDHRPLSLPLPFSAGLGVSCAATAPDAPNAQRPHTRSVSQWPRAHTTHPNPYPHYRVSARTTCRQVSIQSPYLLLQYIISGNALISIIR